MTCQFPLCKSNEYKSGFCIQHNRVYGSKDVAKAPKQISQKSDKRKDEEKIYKRLVKDMLSENSNCEMMVQGVCTGKAQGLHHVQKRTPKNYLEKSNLKRSCNACNLWVELHPQESIKLGLSKSKHIK